MSWRKIAVEYMFYITYTFIESSHIWVFHSVNLCPFQPTKKCTVSLFD